MNLGLEDWQLSQAHSAYSVLSARPKLDVPFKMFLSMDMNVLPSTSEHDAQSLLEKVVGLIRRDGYMRYRGRLVLSTFGGHDKPLGGWGWAGFLDRLNKAIDEKVFPRFLNES